MSATESNKLLKMPVLNEASGLVRGFLGLEKKTKEEQFENIITALENYEAGRTEELEALTQQYYAQWAGTVEKLKVEFAKVWQLFSEIEQRLDGWFCVSPSLGLWEYMHAVRGGYTFSACIMKNHHRDAPLSEKSLSVSFGHDEIPPGIGDERWVGRQGDLSADLVGLENCQCESLKKQYEGALALRDRITEVSIHIRLNHAKIGQKSTKIPITTLSKHSLDELCRNLFILLNNDVLQELEATLDEPEKYLLAEPAKESPLLIANGS